ncbi:MAG: hypothetical protein ACR2RL_10475 [Gammaproteobacteria bacterium]
MKSKHLSLEAIALLGVCSLAWMNAQAAGFAVRVSPPRFELTGDPGETIRGVVQIGNADTETGRYVVRTADWDLDDQGNVFIHPPELRPDSCRPWSRIERRKLTIGPGGTKKYRFEVRVPNDTAPRECRFAILISPAPESEALGGIGDVQIPVAGQIAVVVYVAVGGAQPTLEVQKITVDDVQGRRLPVALIHNSGNAHGRPEGLLEGRDARGQLLDFTVSPSPILPGRTRSISIWPSSPENAQESPEFAFPVRIEGPIEWEGGSYDVDVELR